MKYLFNKKYSILLLIGICIITFALLADFFLSHYIERKVRKKIESIQGRVSFIDVSLWKRSLSIGGLSIGTTEDSANGTHPFLRLKFTTIRSIKLYDLLVENKISANELLLDSGAICYNTNINQAAGSRQQTLKALYFKNIIVRSLFAQLSKDTLVNFSTTLNCHISGVNIKFDSVKTFRYSLQDITITTEQTNISRYAGPYGVSITHFSYDSKSKQAIIDSASLIPNYGKIEFGQHFGEQKSRINLSIPKLTIEGLAVDKLIDTAFIASRIEVQSFDVVAFKDKRLPFLKKENVLMPMEAFSKFRFHTKIDSIIIRDSHITVEEIPEHANESITVRFSNVNGKLGGLDNRFNKSMRPKATLLADGLLMDHGKIKAKFEFPLDGSPTYTARGSISDLPLADLNQVLVNAAAFRVESGKLNNLAFNFNYTDINSIGKIVINYEDLKIIGLKKDKRINEIKTLLLNLFIKDDKTPLLPRSERTGIINIERDRKKFIFNLWWKSILDGLKSSILESDKSNKATTKKA